MPRCRLLRRWVSESPPAAPDSARTSRSGAWRGSSPNASEVVASGRYPHAVYARRAPVAFDRRQRRRIFLALTTSSISSRAWLSVAWSARVSASPSRFRPPPRLHRFGLGAGGVATAVVTPRHFRSLPAFASSSFSSSALSFFGPSLQPLSAAFFATTASADFSGLSTGALPG